MATHDTFESPQPEYRRREPVQLSLFLNLDGFEGPIDVLLTLARDQKVDLTQISILQLAEQYLVFIREAQVLNLELAADYLVMAAWLAYLKSRLLLPAPEGGEELSTEEMAEALRFQLQRLEAMQDAGASLMARPRLGVDVHPRGAPEALGGGARTVLDVTLFELLRAYGDHWARGQAQTLRITPTDLFAVEQAVERLRRMLGATPNWQTLFSFLPPGIRGNLLIRSAMASTFAASLELAKEGRLEIRQDGSFGPIFVRTRAARADEDGGADDRRERDA